MMFFVLVLWLILSCCFTKWLSGGREGLPGIPWFYREGQAVPIDAIGADAI